MDRKAKKVSFSRLRKREMSILLTLAMLIAIVPSISLAAETETPGFFISGENGVVASTDVTITITDHIASELESEIEAWLSKAGVIDSSMASGLSVSGGVLDMTDLAYLGSSFKHLKSVDFSGTTFVDNKVCDICFKDFTDLSEVKLPDSVTVIGAAAFAGCTSIETIICPQDLQTIESIAFMGCISLKSIALPSSVSSIEDYAFNSCASLESIDLLNSGMKEINEGTFFGCTSLTSVILPSSAERIATLAFGDCTSLKAITLPATINVLEHGAFFGCINLADVTMTSPTPPPESHEEAFKDVAGNAVVHVPGGSGSAYRAQGQDTNDMYWCKLYIDDPGREPVLSGGMASRVSETEARVYFSVDILGTHYYYAVVNDGDAPPVINTTGSGYTSIGYFSESIELTDLTAGAKDIYIVAKSGDKLSNTLKVDIGVYTTPFDVVIDDHKAGMLAKEIEDYLDSNGYSGAYDKIRRLKVTGGVLNTADQDYLSISRPRYYWNIEEIDFSETSFKYYDVNDNVMKDGLFRGKSYVTIILPEGLSAISDGAFYDCFSLKNINIPASVTSIGKEAFANCESLEMVIIPANVTRIGDNAFYCCYYLEFVTTLSAVPPKVGNNAFKDVARSVVVSVPKGSASAYKGSDDGDTTDDKWHELTIYERTGADKKIIKVQALNKQVSWGTDKAAIDLPDSVYATLDDGSTLKVEIDWDYEKFLYDGYKQGTYQVTGTIKNLPYGIKNDMNKTAQVTIEVMEPISAVISPKCLSFDLSAPKDIAPVITWNDSSTVTKVICDSNGNTKDMKYSVNGNMLNIDKDDILALSPTAGDSMIFCVFFDDWGMAIFNVDIVMDYQPGTDASLKQLFFNSRSVIGFDPDKYSYEEVVSKDISLSNLVRAISAMPRDWKASMAITPASKLPGSIIVEVTAEDGVTKKTYTVNFTLHTNTITFNRNGGDTDADPKRKTVVSGESLVTLPKEPARSGYTFMGWNTKADGSGTPFTGNTPVDAHITVYAQWKAKPTDNGGSNDGSGSSGGDVSSGGSISSGSTNEVVTSDGFVTIISTISSTLDQDVKATAAITQAQLNSAISLAVAEAVEQGNSRAARVRVEMDAPADAASVEASIPKEAMDSVADGRVEAFTLSTPVAELTFDRQALKVLAEEAVTDVKLIASRVNTQTLSEETRQAVGDRPVFDFRVTSGDKVISQFVGNVSVSVPYTPKEGEDTNAIIIYYINAQGQLEIISNCSYDSSTDTISFTTNHFSSYAVGYNKVSFKDVPAAAWYGDAVTFIAARGISTGTGGGYFSPEAKLTRGQFMVMLMKAYDIAPDMEARDNFADAGATYYTGYLAAAKRLGISDGIGNNMFGPEREITRQEMFTLLYNTLKNLGKLPKGSAGIPLSSFSDAGSIASWAREAMMFMAEAGIIRGNSGKLAPAGTTARAEMAQVLYYLLAK